MERSARGSHEGEVRGRAGQRHTMDAAMGRSGAPSQLPHSTVSFAVIALYFQSAGRLPLAR